MTMTVGELKKILEHANDDDKVVLKAKSLGDSVGGSYSVPVCNASIGFDWDCGKVFINPEQEVRSVDKDYETEQETFRDTSECLAAIWMTANDKRIDNAQKLRYIRQSLKKKGFN